MISWGEVLRLESQGYDLTLGKGEKDKNEKLLTEVYWVFEGQARKDWLRTCASLSISGYLYWVRVAMISATLIGM